MSIFDPLPFLDEFDKEPQRSEIVEAFDRELERCDREIEEMQNQPEDKPAFLTTMGILDWKRERQLIEQERDLLLAHPPSGGCAGQYGGDAQC